MFGRKKSADHSASSGTKKKHSVSHLFHSLHSHSEAAPDTVGAPEAQTEQDKQNAAVTISRFRKVRYLLIH